MRLVKKECLRAGLALLLAVSAARGQATDTLEQNFQQPPAVAKPWVYWYWMDGNISKPGITADLEAMHRVGINGCILLDISLDMPEGKAICMTPEWQSDVKFAISEAARLGMEIDLNSCPGWDGTGSPSVTPEQSMQELSWTHRDVTGPGPFPGVLPQPPSRLNWYQDIAVIAFPSPPEGDPTMDELNPTVTSSSGPVDAKLMFDHDYGTAVKLPLATPKKPVDLVFEFAQPIAMRGLRISSGIGYSNNVAELDVSSDGVNYTKVRDFNMTFNGHNVCTTGIGFSAPASRFYKLIFKNSVTESGGVSLAEVEFSPSFRIDQWATKSVMCGASMLPRDTRNAEGDADAIDPKQIVDLTAKMRPDGSLDWTVPAGHWTVMRFGYTSTAAMNHPAKNQGLQVDKMSRSSLRAGFETYVGKLIRDADPAARAAVTFTHTDSWESGSQNWTAHFEDQFLRLRGYDIHPWLPVLTGRVVGSLDRSERFLWDFRQTCSTLLTDCYYQALVDVAHETGIKVSGETYGQWVLDPLACGGRLDMPMGEYWLGWGPSGDARSMASAAHIYGRPILGNESFTCYDQRWLPDPYRMKPDGDEMLCEGVNKFVIHQYTQQPFMNVAPGMTMAGIGLNIGRTDTWWDQGAPFMAYLTRCSTLLQQGLFVPDVAYLMPEDTGYPLLQRYKMVPPIPEGYDFDTINADCLIKNMTVDQGTLKLADGISYRVLRLPAAGRMDLPLLRKIKELVEGGATVVGPRPIGTPGLGDFPASEDEFKSITDELWGGDAPKIVDLSVADALTKLAIPPDVKMTPKAYPLHYIHHRTGTADIYFIADESATSYTSDFVFRIGGKQPELWHADTGVIEPLPVYTDSNGRTTIPLHFNAHESVFVIFRSPTDPRHIVKMTCNGSPIFPLAATPTTPDDTRPHVNLKPDGTVDLFGGSPGNYELTRADGTTASVTVPDPPAPTAISGPWDIAFQANRGAPDTATFDQLMSWPESPVEGIKYFSGTATYTKSFDFTPPSLSGDAKPRYFLDLGDVKNFAQVRLNGHDLGILWKPPFRVDVTDSIQSGTNALEVAVTNLWPNRLIGDEQLPSDVTWKGKRLAEWPAWFLQGETRPVPQRVTFTTWKHWSKTDKPIPSGLLGPVQVVVVPDCPVP